MMAQVLVDGVAEIAGFIYIGLLTWLVFNEAMAATARNEIQDITYLDMPVWPARWILPIAFGLMAIVMLLQAIDDLRFAITGKGPRHFSPQTSHDFEGI